MNSFRIKKVNESVSKLDKMIRVAVDRVLPKNLTIRYIAALIIVAALAISRQMIIQTSLTHQTEDQRKIRLMERQIHDSENLRKAIQSLQLSSKESQIKIQIDLIESLASQFQKNAENLQHHGITAQNNAHPPEELLSTLSKIDTSLTGVSENCRVLSTVTDPQLDYRLNTTTFDLLNHELAYRSGLTEVSKYYEKSLEKNVSDFKRIELFLLFTTLLVLFIEALYVFRPAVESLYDALRTRSEFLGRMGHEMRNPMNSILGMTNLLLETPLNDQQRKYLSILQKSSTGLLEVLNNLLDFSSLESGSIKTEKTPFDLYKLLERSIDSAVYGAHANGIELILDLDTHVPLQLSGDPMRLQQILTNLLGNAVKFTKQGEVILRVQLQRKSEDTWIQFSVIDSGIGIEKDKINKIFDAFVQEDSTVRRRFGGTGLGLSISRDLVSLLGGTLHVESQKNLGSRFYFTLPFTSTQDQNVDSTIPLFDFGSYDVQIVEPNQPLLETITKLITQSGGRTQVAQSSRDIGNVLNILSQSSGKKEIAIIDYEHIKDSISSLFSGIRKGAIKSDSFIFLVKTTTSSAEIEKLAEYGIRNFIFKPVKPIQLLEAIQQCLNANAPQHSLSLIESKNNISSSDRELIDDQRPLRILAADDSKDNQFLIKAYLASLPYRITFAENGRIAVEKFKAGQFDIILMDLQMPEMDGYTATKIIRDLEDSERLSPVPTPIVAVSAHDQRSGLNHLQGSGFSAYLVKPISPNQLRKTIIQMTQHISAPESKIQNPIQIGNGSAIDQLEKELADLAPQYLDNRRRELLELKTLLDNSNFDKIGTLGHRLRGNAKSYGFDELGNIGAELEESARTQNVQHIFTLIQKTENYLKQFSKH